MTVGNVKIDLDRRSMGFARRLWNKATPTRWANRVCAEIAAIGKHKRITLFVSQYKLSIKQEGREIPLAYSHAYAAALFRAGVTEIEFGAGLSFKEIKDSFNMILDEPLKLSHDDRVKIEVRDEDLQGVLTERNSFIKSREVSFGSRTSLVNAIVELDYISQKTLAIALMEIVKKNFLVIDKPGKLVYASEGNNPELPSWDEYECYWVSRERTCSLETEGEVSHFEFNPKDIERGVALLQKRNLEFRANTLTAIREKNPELAEILDAKLAGN